MIKSLDATFLKCRQETASMLPPLFLGLTDPSLSVLDMCAAPGDVIDVIGVSVV
jgi:hypothetical protein